MCGLAGVLLSSPEESLATHPRSIVTTVLNQQRYRGRDAQGFEEIVTPHSRLLLGHNRLSIVDLSHRSQQPMWDDTRRFCLAYNGMLYNYLEIKHTLSAAGHTFFSQGDTEVVLKAFIEWGSTAFNYFNGMFACVIFDVDQEKLYLVRDRFGVKPLYYYANSEQLFFASTSSELAARLNLGPNLTEIAKGLHYWCSETDDRSVYQDLLLVKPGSIVTVSANAGLKVAHDRYYCLSERVAHLENHVDSVSKTTEKLDSLIHDAVALRLRSDVSIGVTLSGGIDSSLVTLLAAQKQTDIRAFCYGSLSQSETEAKAAQLTALKAGIDVTFIAPDANAMVTAFDQVLQLQDTPFPTLSVVAQYCVFQSAARQGIKVMLGGQGGDEIFMGYRKYLFFYLQRLLHQKHHFHALRYSLGLIPTLLTQNILSYPFMLGLRRYFGRPNSKIWHHDFEALDLRMQPENPMWQRQLSDITTFSLPTLLRYEDRNAMGHGVESRLPFLDYRLVEFALSLPTPLKLRQGYGKWLLREVGAAYLPSSVCWARAKRGFDVNHGRWLASGIGERIRQILASNRPLLHAFGIRDVRLFSDAALSKNPANLAQALMLAWLAVRPHFHWN